MVIGILVALVCHYKFVDNIPWTDLLDKNIAVFNWILFCVYACLRLCVYVRKKT